MDRSEGGRGPRADSRLFAGVGNGPVVGASLVLYPLLTLVTCVAIEVLDGLGDLLFMIAFIGIGLPLAGILAVAATVMGLIAGCQRRMFLFVLGGFVIGGFVSVPIGMAILFPS